MVGEWIKEAQQINIVTIYLPFDIHNKIVLWDSVKQLKDSLSGGLWCILGYFNSIRDPDERFGSGHRLSGDSSIKEFNDWIDDIEVLEVPWLARKST